MPNLVKFLVLFIVGFSAEAGAVQPGIEIVTSIPPLAAVARELTGPSSTVESVIGKMSDPHSFDLKGSQAGALERATIVLLVGDGYEPWARGIPAKKIISIADSLPSDFKRLEGNNHYWVDPEAMRYLARNINKRLKDIAPDKAEVFDGNLKIFEDELTSISKEVAVQIESWKHKTFFSTHPTWSYFAARFGFVELGALRSNHGRELGAKKVVDLYSDAKVGSGHVIFKEAHEPHEVIHSFVKDTGVKEVTLDALGEDSEKYVDLIRRNFLVMSKEMKE
jgi:ABC-type Zn uptake system ZnuABC Zn-binding protein ZnuA